MIEKFIALIQNGIQYVRMHPQLLLTLLLIFVIPIAFLINGEQFLGAAKDNRERLEKDRLGIMHDIFASYLSAVSFDPEKITVEIKKIATLNPDIKKFRVAKETPEGIITIADLNPQLVNRVEENVSPYRLAQVQEGESIISEYRQNGERHWQSFRLVRSDLNEEYYIFTETSLANLDTLFTARMRTAYYWLFGLLAIVMLLIFRHIRLIDYGHLYREVKKANEMKDLFTNMIAHELRAPLTAMCGYASMIAENSHIEVSVREQAKKIEQSSERLVVIVSDLLDIARIQSGKLTVTREAVNVITVIDSVIDTLSPSAEAKHIVLRAEGVKNASVLADSKRLHQAFTNLVSNAIKYTKEGFITITIESRHDRIEVRVKDTGMGISAQDQKELFAPFFRVKSDDVSAITGTGLGMWITKQLIELMGGSIGVESIRNVGTHVVVTLPKS